ncbi:MAG: insulinase family protein, partial [Clostridia bacterium]|nr:insulinase family protein [Clostridia bacterium]
MITFTTREDPFIREKYRTGTHESGIRIIVIKKKIPAFSACVCVDFGARDLEYVSGGERFTLPPGTAHFLEHKMFEDPDGCDYMQRFEQLGGFANAYTSYRGTSFVCSGTREVYKNLGILLESVSSAHFTAASVARERDIIKREIVMYEDLPEDAAGQELLRMLYREHPLTKPISGTAGSVGRIGKATLARAFREFYVPSN